MNDALLLTLLVIGFIVLDIAAALYGHDSREALGPTDAHPFDHY